MRVAAAQAASVWLDPAATTQKRIGLLEQASRQGVELVAFPETFLSGYPFWVMLGGGGPFGDPKYARAYAAYLESTVEIDAPELRRVAEAVSDLHVFVYLGVSERGRGSGRRARAAHAPGWASPGRRPQLLGELDAAGAAHAADRRFLIPLSSRNVGGNCAAKQALCPQLSG